MPWWLVLRGKGGTWVGRRQCDFSTALHHTKPPAPSFSQENQFSEISKGVNQGFTVILAPWNREGPPLTPPRPPSRSAAQSPHL